MLSPYTGIVNFKLSYDNGVNFFIDDSNCISNFLSNIENNDTFSINLVKDKYYTFYTEYYQGSGGFYFILYWDYSGHSQIKIPSSNLFLPSLVGSSPYNIQIVQSIWGDRIKTGAEGWDDGNTNNGDGCSSSWLIETGWIWRGGSISSWDIWSEICGDGKRFNSNQTYWDDGNTNSGDGCSSTCLVETGWTWNGGSNISLDKCIEVWGDGIRFNSIFK